MCLKSKTLVQNGSNHHVKLHFALLLSVELVFLDHPLRRSTSLMVDFGTNGRIYTERKVPFREGMNLASRVNGRIGLSS